jgi:hypothetical protein
VTRSRASTVADLGRELRDLTQLARERPILIVGGALALLLLAAAVNRNGGAGEDEAELDPELDGELGLDGATGESSAAPGSLTFGAGYGLPSYGIDGAGGYDPFSTDPATQTAEVERTPEGCPLPKPAIPSGLSGQGDWVCSSGRWVWKSKGTGAPKSSGKTGPRIVINKGATFIHYRIDRNRLRGEQRKAANAVTWRTSAEPRTMRTWGGSTVRVVQLREGPLKGRWVTIGGSGKRWYPS